MGSRRDRLAGALGVLLLAAEGRAVEPIVTPPWRQTVFCDAQGEEASYAAADLACREPLLRVAWSARSRDRSEPLRLAGCESRRGSKKDDRCMLRRPASWVADRLTFPRLHEETIDVPAGEPSLRVQLSGWIAAGQTALAALEFAWRLLASDAPPPLLRALDQPAGGLPIAGGELKRFSQPIRGLGTCAPVVIGRTIVTRADGVTWESELQSECEPRLRDDPGALVRSFRHERGLDALRTRLVPGRLFRWTLPRVLPEPQDGDEYVAVSFLLFPEDGPQSSGLRPTRYLYRTTILIGHPPAPSTTRPDSKSVAVSTSSETRTATGATWWDRLGPASRFLQRWGPLILAVIALVVAAQRREERRRSGGRTAAAVEAEVEKLMSRVTELEKSGRHDARCPANGKVHRQSEHLAGDDPGVEPATGGAPANANEALRKLLDVLEPRMLEIVDQHVPQVVERNLEDVRAKLCEVLEAQQVQGLERLLAERLALAPAEDAAAASVASAPADEWRVSATYRPVVEALAALCQFALVLHDQWCDDGQPKDLVNRAWACCARARALPMGEKLRAVHVESIVRGLDAIVLIDVPLVLALRRRLDGRAGTDANPALVHAARAFWPQRWDDAEDVKRFVCDWVARRVPYLQVVVEALPRELDAIEPGATGLDAALGRAIDTYHLTFPNPAIRAERRQSPHRSRDLASGILHTLITDLVRAAGGDYFPIRLYQDMLSTPNVQTVANTTGRMYPFDQSAAIVELGIARERGCVVRLVRPCMRFENPKSGQYDWDGAVQFLEPAPET